MVTRLSGTPGANDQTPRATFGAKCGQAGDQRFRAQAGGNGTDGIKIFGSFLKIRIRGEEPYHFRWCGICTLNRREKASHPPHFHSLQSPSPRSEITQANIQPLTLYSWFFCSGPFSCGCVYRDSRGTRRGCGAGAQAPCGTPRSGPTGGVYGPWAPCPGSRTGWLTGIARRKGMRVEI